MEKESFGQYISQARKGKGLSQKELAQSVKIEADDGTIKSLSPQYLNDIEHDRRNPSSNHLVEQFARILGLDAEYLSFLADRWPESFRAQVRSKEDFNILVNSFRKTHSG